MISELCKMNNLKLNILGKNASIKDKFLEKNILKKLFRII